MNARILLLGTGYTLRRVAALLRPHDVLLTSRKSEQIELWRKKGLEAVAFDGSHAVNTRRLPDIFSECSIVIDSIPPSDSDPAALPGLLVANLPQVKRFVYLSTTGVFGVEDGSWVDEATPCNPKHMKAHHRFLAEERYRNYAPTTILRLPAIYGPGRGLYQSLKKGTFPLVDDGMRWSNRAHVDDIARAIVRVIFAVEAPELLCVSDDAPTLSKDVVQFYCNRFDLPPPQRISRAEVESRGMTSLLSNQRVRNNGLKQFLGEPLLYPSFRAGAETELQEDAVLCGT